MFIINHKKIFISISAFLVLASFFSILFFGLNFGIDFKGGTLLEIKYTKDIPDKKVIENSLSGVIDTNFVLQESDNGSFILRTQSLDTSLREKILKVLSLDNSYPFEKLSLQQVGPSIGQELRNKAFVAMAVVIAIIIIFIAFVFRAVSKPVSSWKYGLVAIVALIHDIIIPLGIFAFLGSLNPLYEVNVLFITALLAILGFSVNDTIVIFDRIRENLRDDEETHKHEEFGNLVGKSLSQTFTRSINTSFTTLIVLLCLYFIGGEATKNFSLVLAFGVIFGTYSSIFLASPLLVILRNWQKK